MAAANGSIRDVLSLLGKRDIGSLLIEGGATLHGAAWDEGAVDFVRLYIAPTTLGAGVALLPGRHFSSSELIERRVETLGPDVMIEGYGHGPR